jgi:NADPH-dependent ferric siderophore reductase
MSSDSPFVLSRVTVRSVERVSPTFARITFEGGELDQMGTPGHVLDQRIKLVFPGPSGRTPELTDSDDWYQAWLAVPEEERGSMRTYSIRELVIDDGVTTVVLDFVLHVDRGSSGPASRWALSAEPGDEILLLGPRRGRRDGGGIEYSPGEARAILLAGDETAAPAIARILEDVDREVRGIAFIEIPYDDDALEIDAPPGVDVRWVPRSGAAHGTALIPSVLDYLGSPAAVEIADIETEDLLWETPVYSGLGETLPESGEDSHPDRYFWIAGESGVVTTLRRHLVKDLGVNRSQVAFMGYWRKGVAMRG